MTATNSPYSERFFQGNAASAAQSARPILQLVHDLYHPVSIVDIGCGSGGWLAAAEQLGFSVLVGYDGPWADPAKYTTANIDFRPVNLETSTFEHDRRYDLAMSLEVAEHLSEPRADVIVDLLCAASDVVLFGAAITMQGGWHHIHERPQSYWIEKFRARGYEPFDVIRPAVWDDDEIRWWFRQNTILYVKEGSHVIDREVLRAMQKPLWDVVHPANYQRRMRAARGTAAELRAAQKEIADLRSRIDAGGKPRRAKLRELTPSDLPEPVRAAAVKGWQALPAPVRARLRGR
jgi:SAM-dependent methyltransferase